MIMADDVDRAIEQFRMRSKTETRVVESIRVNPRSQLIAKLEVDGVVVMAIPLAQAEDAAFGIQVHAMLRGGSVARTMIPWESVEDIARYVAGNGTDAQRVALADAIREGRKP